jgi:hypothetical protein
MTTRGWLLLGAVAAGALVFALWAERGDGKRTRPAAVAVDAPARPGLPASAPAPDRDRALFAETIARFPGRGERERHDAPVAGGVVRIGPRVGGKGAPAAAPAVNRQSAAVWVSSYAVAMCDCRTRACAADLQGRFIHAMGGVEYDEARDSVTYHDAVKKAVDCYFALPEGT